MARRDEYEVTIVNPRKKRKKSKSPSKKRKKPAAKKAKPNPMAKRKRRRSRPAAAAAPRRKRRRTKSNPSRARRYGKHVARRGGFLGGFGTIDPMGPMRSGLLARLAGKVAAVWVVRKWGGKMPEDGATSETTGNAWGFQQYLFALLAGYVGGELIGRFTSKHVGEQFYAGAFDMTATKIMWTEVINRQDAKGKPSWPAAQEALGQGQEFRQLAAQAQEGDIIDDGDGNRWMMKNGRLEAMMGVGPVDYLGGVKEADYLGSMDGVGPVDYLGHMMVASATTAEADSGQYLRRGSPDPYHAAYL